MRNFYDFTLIKKVTTQDLNNKYKYTRYRSITSFEFFLFVLRANLFLRINMVRGRYRRRMRTIVLDYIYFFFKRRQRWRTNRLKSSDFLKNKTYHNYLFRNKFNFNKSTPIYLYYNFYDHSYLDELKLNFLEDYLDESVPVEETHDDYDYYIMTLSWPIISDWFTEYQFIFNNFTDLFNETPNCENFIFLIDSTTKQNSNVLEETFYHNNFLLFHLN